jgi:hypothetical protein
MQVVINVPSSLGYRQVEKRERIPDLHLFETTSPRRHNGWPTFAVSCLIHALAIWLLPVVAEYIPASWDGSKELRFVVRPLNIRVPERLYLASAGSDREKGKAPAPATRKAERTKLPEPAPVPAAKRATRMFQLPDLPIRARGDQTLLQPQYAPQLAPQENVRLPDVMFWASQVPSLPRPAAKRFVLPGRTDTAAQPPKLNATPRLEMPNLEMATADITVAGANLDRMPALPRPSSTTMPIRTFDPPRPGPPQRNMSIDVLEGDPTNVLALAPDAPPLSEILHVPAGNLRAPLLIVPHAEGGEGTESNPAPAAKGGGFGARGVAAAEGAGTAPGGLAKSPIASFTPVPGALSSTITQLSAGMALRVVHATNGVFDVVVQSSSSDALPESAGILSGRPIYTVYLRVGAPKEWMLQYCIPNAMAAQISAGVVTLGTPAPLKAPFPRLTFRPLAEMFPKEGYIMVHGMITELGKFRDLKTVGRVDPKVGALLLAFLEKWEFRPATRDEQPVPVEILIAIPPGA